MAFPPEMMRELLETRVAFIERMGLKAEILEPRFIRLRLPLAGNENHIGTMYAGALFSLGEVPLGALFLTTFDPAKCYPIVKEMNIKYVKFVKSDVTIEMALSEDKVNLINSEIESQGKSEFILEGEIKDESGDTVAITRGVFQLRAVGR